MEKGNLKYPPQDGLFFHFSDFPPEKMLLNEYLAHHPNAALQYHLDNSNVHCLLQNMVEVGIAVNETNAIDLCFAAYRNAAAGAALFE